MAGNSGKKIAAENANTLRICLIGNVASAIFFVLVRMLVFYDSLGTWSIIGFASVNAVQIFLYFQFSKQVDKGLDINTKGLNEYIQDILYISWAVLVLTPFTDYAWYLLLVIPAFALYQAWTLVLSPLWNARNTFQGGAGGGGAPGPSFEGQPVEEEGKKEKRKVIKVRGR